MKAQALDVEANRPAAGVGDAGTAPDRPGPAVRWSGRLLAVLAGTLAAVPWVALALVHFGAIDPWSEPPGPEGASVRDSVKWGELLRTVPGLLMGAALAALVSLPLVYLAIVGHLIGRRPRSRATEAR